MTALNAQPEASVRESSVLSVRHLTKSFGGLKAIDDVTFDVAPHQVTAMIGPNGAGKTTVFNLVTNLLAKDAGQVRFLGRDLAGMSAVKIADMGLIRTFQSARVFPGMTAIENVMVGGHRLPARSGASERLWLAAARSEEDRGVRRAA